MAVSKRLRYEVLRRDGHTCRYCGRRAPDAILTVDHVLPTTLGGSDSPANLVTACQDCNAGKSSANPDSPLVADVADDALRWARAMRLAADDLIVTQAERDGIRSAFEEHWNGWTFGGQSVPLPVDWPITVDRFIAAGLPLPALLDCVDIAMRAPHVRINNVHRYMCGVAWGKVRDLQEKAASFLGEPSSPGADSAVDICREIVGLVAVDFPRVCSMVDAGARAELTRRFDEAHAEDEDERGQAIQYGHWPPDLRAFARAIEIMQEYYWYQSQTIYTATTDLIGGRENLPALLVRARQRCIESGWPDPAPDDLERAALHLAVEDALGGRGLS